MNCSAYSYGKACTDTATIVLVGVDENLVEHDLGGCCAYHAWTARPGGGPWVRVERRPL